MNFNFITNPKTGKKVSIFGKTGQTILKHYIKSRSSGGHNGPCALGKKGRCVKSTKADNNCKVSAKGRCAKSTKGAAKASAKRKKTKKPAKKTARKTAKKTYRTLDNGGRPFLVTVAGKHLTVHKIDDDWNPDYNPKIKIKNSDYKENVFETNFQQIFIGSDPKAVDGLGNSILIRVSGNQYVHIGINIFSFKTKERLIGYASPIGKARVTYPYAVGPKYTYVMSEQIKLLNTAVEHNEPYDTYYNNESVGKQFKHTIIQKR